jgi:hypothetical protein
MPNFTTGPATLFDVGILSYNGCVFSPLYETKINGIVVKDNAGRTTKLMEYTLEADGYVTLPDNANSTAGVVTTLRQLLTAQAGILVYQGRGNDFVVNQPGVAMRNGPGRDVAWGPVPELLDFQPLGGGRSAKITWKVKFRISEISGDQSARQNLYGAPGPVLQFNEETSVTYDEAAYSTLSIRGTLEIPLTRATQSTRTLTRTVDNFRQAFMNQVAASINLSLFRVTRREFNISRDKRTLEWDFAAEELPYMGLPPNVMVARGSFNFRPAKTGMGLCSWLCTLRATYTVVKDQPRRTAWISFLALLRTRMNESRFGTIPVPGSPQNPVAIALGAAVTVNLAALTALNQMLTPQNANVANARRAMIIDFSGDEGLYLDSKTMTFSATWRLITTISGILIASGLWKKAPFDGGNQWAVSVANVSGWQGNLQNNLDPTQDLIVDFGAN